MKPDAVEIIARRLEELVAELRSLHGSSQERLAVPADKPQSRVVDSETIGADELAVILKVGPRTIRRWAHLRKLPKPMRIGNRMRWRCRAIERWQKEREL